MSGTLGEFMDVIAIARGRVRFVVFGLLASALTAGCSLSGNIDVKTPMSFTSDSKTIQVVSALVGGKNVFIPSTIVVTSGATRTLSLFNTTDTPHGFRIAALGIEAILPSKQEYRVELPALEGGRVYQINCHLHPPHRTAVLVVLPGD